MSEISVDGCPIALLFKNAQTLPLMSQTSCCPGLIALSATGQDISLTSPVSLLPDRHE
jgi:hypothetical protein